MILVVYMYFYGVYYIIVNLNLLLLVVYNISWNYFKITNKINDKRVYNFIQSIHHQRW